MGVWVEVGVEVLVAAGAGVWVGGTGVWVGALVGNDWVGVGSRVAVGVRVRGVTPSAGCSIWVGEGMA
jgi:hypothetical protein